MISRLAVGCLALATTGLHAAEPDPDALLAFSTLPVLRAIGITVAAGVVSDFVLALLLTRPPELPDDAR